MPKPEPRPAVSRLPWPVLALTAMLAGLQGLFFSGLYRGRASFPHDFPRAYYAWTAYWQTSVMAGEWPHWLPFQSMGYPFAINLQSGIYYPPFWLFVLFRLPYTLTAANIFHALHIAGGAIGTFLLVRALLRSPWVAVAGGVAFHLFGGLFTNAEHADILRGYCLLPWLLWSCLLVVPDRGHAAEGASPGRLLAWRNYLLPATLFFFLTGSYPGVAFAGLFLAAVFLSAQLLPRMLRGRRLDRASLASGAVVAGLFGAGLLCSFPFLLPSAYLSRFLVRSLPTFADLERIRFFLAPIDFIQFLFPTLTVNTVWRPVYPNEGSMLGMQTPVVLLLFLGCVTWPCWKRLAPFLATLPFVAIMCFEPAAPMRRVLTTVIPPLGLSRFPAGDYRIYLWLSVLLAALCGMANFLRSTAASRNLRPLGRLVGAACVFGLVAAWVSQYAVPPSGAGDFRRLLSIQAMTVAGLLALALARSLWRVPEGLFVLVLCGVATFSVLRLYWAMQYHWYFPDAEFAIYTNQKVPLFGPDGNLAATQIFSRPPGPRPPRTSTGEVSRGYVTGEYQTTDWGGAETVWHRRIIASPAMTAFMMRASELRAWPCTKVDCLSRDLVNLAIDTADPALLTFETINYARNSATYRLMLREPALVVENEVYAPGWTGTAKDQRLEAREVNGALRGWVLPAGNSRVTVQYDTPFFGAARWFAVIGVVLWFWLLVLEWRRTRSASLPAGA